MQEGPHSTLPEDEFFDAVESGLDKIEEDRQLRVRLKLQSQQVKMSKVTDLVCTLDDGKQNIKRQTRCETLNTINASSVIRGTHMSTMNELVH